MGTIGFKDSIGNTVNYLHAGTIKSEGTQVAGSAHATGERQGIVVGRLVVLDGQQVATGYAGTLHKDVALLHVENRTLLFLVLHIYMRHHLEVSLRGETLVLPTLTVNSEQERQTLLQFATVAVSAAT